VQAHGLDRRPRVELRRVDDEERLHVDADDVPDQLPRREEDAGGAWKREIRRRFNVSVPRARASEKASTLRGRSERWSLVPKSAETSGKRPREKLGTSRSFPAPVGAREVRGHGVDGVALRVRVVALREGLDLRRRRRTVSAPRRRARASLAQGLSSHAGGIVSLIVSRLPSSASPPFCL
jgi:hypothetical protein